LSTANEFTKSGWRISGNVAVERQAAAQSVEDRQIRIIGMEISMTDEQEMVDIAQAPLSED
jgi:hypothetical protein